MQLFQEIHLNRKRTSIQGKIWQEQSVSLIMSNEATLQEMDKAEQRDSLCQEQEEEPTEELSKKVAQQLKKLFLLNVRLPSYMSKMGGKTLAKTIN